MRHLACVLHPRERGLTPYRVVFRRAQSPPVPSLWDVGLWYTIAEVLTYHYQHTWSHLRVLTT